MKNSKLMLSTAVAVCAMLGVGAASAADLAVKAMPYAAPMLVFSWTGFYVGGNIGGGWSNTNLTNTVSDGAIAWPDLAPGQGIGYNHSGVVGGGQIGVNFRAMSRGSLLVRSQTLECRLMARTGPTGPV